MVYELAIQGTLETTATSAMEALFHIKRPTLYALSSVVKTAIKLQFVASALEESNLRTSRYSQR